LNSAPTLLRDVLRELPYQGPDYAPPYDSPIEDEFAKRIVTLLPSSAEWIPQFEIATQCGTYRIDFVCKFGKRTIGFECDGKKHHAGEVERERDRWRDALMMGTGKVNAIYRIPGSRIFYQPDRVIYLISRGEPSLLSERGEKIVTSVVRPDVISVERFESASFLQYRWYPDSLAHLSDDQDTFEQAWTSVTIRIDYYTDRRFYDNEPEWSHMMRFARQHKGKTLKQIIQLRPFRH
jgi:very-short-patch-repair endonuclease